MEGPSQFKGADVTISTEHFSVELRRHSGRPVEPSLGAAGEHTNVDVVAEPADPTGLALVRLSAAASVSKLDSNEACGKFVTLQAPRPNSSSSSARRNDAGNRSPLMRQRVRDGGTDYFSSGCASASAVALRTRRLHLTRDGRDFEPPSWDGSQSPAAGTSEPRSDASSGWDNGGIKVSRYDRPWVMGRPTPRRSLSAGASGRLRSQIRGAGASSQFRSAESRGGLTEAFPPQASQGDRGDGHMAAANRSPLHGTAARKLYAGGDPDVQVFVPATFPLIRGTGGDPNLQREGGQSASQHDASGGAVGRAVGMLAALQEVLRVQGAGVGSSGNSGSATSYGGAGTIGQTSPALDSPVPMPPRTGGHSRLSGSLRDDGDIAAALRYQMLSSSPETPRPVRALLLARADTSLSSGGGGGDVDVDSFKPLPSVSPRRMLAEAHRVRLAVREGQLGDLLGALQTELGRLLGEHSRATGGPDAVETAQLVALLTRNCDDVLAQLRQVQAQLREAERGFSDAPHSGADDYAGDGDSTAEPTFAITFFPSSMGGSAPVSAESLILPASGDHTFTAPAAATSDPAPDLMSGARETLSAGTPSDCTTAYARGLSEPLCSDTASPSAAPADDGRSPDLFSRRGALIQQVSAYAPEDADIGTAPVKTSVPAGQTPTSGFNKDRSATRLAPVPVTPLRIVLSVAVSGTRSQTFQFDRRGGGVTNRGDHTLSDSGPEEVSRSTRLDFANTMGDVTIRRSPALSRAPAVQNTLSDFSKSRFAFAAANAASSAVRTLALDKVRRLARNSLDDGGSAVTYLNSPSASRESGLPSSAVSPASGARQPLVQAAGSTPAPRIQWPLGASNSLFALDTPGSAATVGGAAAAVTPRHRLLLSQRPSLGPEPSPASCWPGQPLSSRSASQFVPMPSQPGAAPRFNKCQPAQRTQIPHAQAAAAARIGGTGSGRDRPVRPRPAKDEGIAVD